MEEMLRELDELRTEQEKLKKKVSELQLLVKYYEERERLSLQKRFGSSSEKTEDPGQHLLGFDEAEVEAKPKESEPSVEEITYRRRRRSGTGQDDLSALPVETITHAIPEEERICPSCGGAMHVMGHETRRELEIVPAQVKILEHVREVCSCRNCERTGTSVPITKASMPEPVIKGSAASASFVAYIMIQKYMNAMPLYRQEQAFLQNGFILSRQTMANWLLRCSMDWLEPLYELMRRQLLAEAVLHADETVLQVLREPGRASRNQSYMWLYCTGVESEFQIVLYEYQETRSSSHPKRFLAGFSGFLHADGYSAYHRLSEKILVVGCWAHVRRKFDEALKSAPPDGRADSASQKGLDFCNELFALEKQYEDLTPEKRHQERLKRSKPLSDDFFRWCKESNALPKSLLGKAVHYALEQRAYLENVYLDGRLELSNNRAERSIKPFVIGRKNWLFSCTPKGAKASSVIYSLIETAKANGLKPFEYLRHILETMPNNPPETYPNLLPWSDSLPESCRLTSKPDTAPDTA